VGCSEPREERFSRSAYANAGRIPCAPRERPYGDIIIVTVGHPVIPGACDRHPLSASTTAASGKPTSTILSCILRMRENST
jgi:hypothetical protein